MKFLKGSRWYSYINLNTKSFDFFKKILSPWLWPQGHPLDPKVTPGVGMVLLKTLDLYLPSGQIWIKSIKDSSKYEVL